MSLLDNLTIDDLDADQRELAECVGLEAYKKLVENYAGSYVYIQKTDTITAGLRNAAIQSEFNGYNYLDLAKKYNLSESSVRRIVAEKLIAIKAAPLENQLSMFET